MALPASKSPVILVVENEVVTLMNTVDLLIEQGYRAIAQTNTDWALATLSTRSDIDLLVTDIDLPGALAGLTLARIVERRWPAIAIIVTSYHGCPAPGELPETARFLPRPCASSTLVAAVREDLAVRCRCGLGWPGPHETAS
jgi:CheY-like chemotaxis protein